MKGFINWYSKRKKCGLIEGKDRENVMIYEKDIPFLTILHQGDPAEYIIEKTINGLKTKKINQFF